MVLKIVLIVKE